MNTYLITGGTGFIGANLTRKIRQQEPEASIHVITQPDANLWRLADLAFTLSIHELDLLDFTAITSLVQHVKPNIIFHLAAYGGMPYEQDQAMIYRVNFDATINLFNACKKIGFDCFINTGSSSEYGKKNHAMHEDDILEPISDYGLAKAAATQFCRKEALINNLPAYTVRPFSVYGRYEMATRLIPTVITSALTNKPINLANPHSVRDFIYIDDMVNLYLTLAQKKPHNTFVFNAGNGIQSKIKDITDTIQNIMQQELPITWGTQQARPWEPTHWQADINQANEILDWQPSHTLHSGLEKTITWFKKHLHLYHESFPNEQHSRQQSP